ncbi:MAG TPA: OpgC domain-containing protein [Dehalococcoidia bacterium]|nr:OpgC domain-containing protein [Dehalococcoidia bacterium]
MTSNLAPARPHAVIAPPHPQDRPASPTSTPYHTASGRDLRYDLLRGYFVFAMVVDHIQGPSWVHWITGGNRFFTSAAEGFIFISGLLAGQVYRRLIERDGLGAALQKLMIRAGHLYVLAVALTLLFLPLSELLDLPWAQGVDLTNPAAFILSVVTLHRTYHFVDVPQIYALLLFVSPLAFIFLAQGRARIVLLGSWGLWGLYQAYPQFAELPWPIAGNYVFNFSAWQVLFFNGVVIGYCQPTVRRWILRIPRPLILGLTLTGTALLIALFTVFDQFTSSLAGLDDSVLTTGQLRILTLTNELFGKGDLGVGRLLAFAIVFGFLFAWVTALWRPIRRAIGWLLIPLGQEALYAYTAHVVLAAVVAIGVHLVWSNASLPAHLNAVTQIASVAAIWLLVRGRIFLPTPQTRRYYLLSPVVCAVVVLLLFPWDAAPSMPGFEAAPSQGQAQAADGSAAEQPASVVRAVRSFGTPVPKVDPQAAVTPMPLPKPPPPENNAPIAPATGPSFREGQGQVSQYVGTIRGTFREATFYSSSLDAERAYFIYLPPDYGTAGRRYPVLYMLHGASGDKEEWPAIGLIDLADQMIESGEIPPMIIVLPGGDFGYWANNVDDGPRWADYVRRDLVRHIDTAYRSLPRARNRAIGGLSFGGHGALQIGLQHPRVFGVIGAHSPSLHVDDETLINILGTGEEFEKRDPVAIARVAQGLEHQQIWLDVGIEDNFRERVEELAAYLIRGGATPEFHEYPGEHGFDYWVENVISYLRWYGQALAGQ